MARKVAKLTWPILVLLLASACSMIYDSPTDAQEVNNAPAILQIGWMGSPDSLNPGVALESTSFTIFDLVYDSLFEYDLNGHYAYDLLEEMLTSADNLQYTFTIRSDVIFHDGTSLTAQDVAFSLNYYKDHEEFQFMNLYTQPFESITVLNDTTIVLRLNQVVPSIEYQLADLYILPEHIWSAYDNEQAVDFPNLELIGSGPFRLESFIPGELVSLRVNTDWYGIGPKIDGIEFHTFPDEESLVQGIISGQVDMITEVPLTSAETLLNQPDVKLVTGAPLAPDVTDILINQVLPENCPTEDGICSGHPALRDRTVRMAMAYSVNKSELISDVLLGMGSQGLTLIPESLTPWFNTEIEDYPYDPEESNRILDEAGYIDINGDDVREMPDGSHPLIFRINWADESILARQVAYKLKDEWALIGIKLELQMVDSDTLANICCPAFDYDLIIWGWGSDPDPSFLLSAMITREIPTGMSETGYSNPAFDSLFEQQAVTVDPELRRQLVWQMQQIVFDDVVYIIPFYSDAVQAYRTDTFTGWPTNEEMLALEDLHSLLQIEPIK